MDLVLLTFANSQTNPLPSLRKEDDEVYRILVDRELRGHFSLHREQYITLDKLNYYLNKFEDRLVIFHYSGHAGSKTLSFDTEDANAVGLSTQLGKIAREGKLKLVILNGCSTAGQVNQLLDAGVPAVVATHAPVEDQSATTFSIRFFQSLSEKRLSIQDAFEDALGPAQTVTQQSIQKEIVSRAAGHRKLKKEELKKPVWGLFVKDDEILQMNPLPVRKSKGSSDFMPNDKLTKVLFQTLGDAQCFDIQMLQQKEGRGDYVEMGDKQTTIVNVLPFPIAIHLQKVLCPVETEGEGFDKVGLARLHQIGTLFHTTLELVAIVMLAQLWEFKLKEKISSIAPELIDKLKEYFHLGTDDRAVFDYIKFIRSIRIFFDSIQEGPEVIYFISELGHLKDLLQEGGDFSNACNYLSNLRFQTVKGNIREDDVHDFCQEAEDKLCDFFEHLGFLHRYSMTSVQNIDILNYRHQTKPIFKHNMVKLMRAIGKPERSHYLLEEFTDNRGVVLLKGNVTLVDARKKEFTSEHLDYLNLSPFVIDRNAFEANTDLSNLFFFDYYLPGQQTYSYKNVKRPDAKRDSLDVNAEDIFHGVFIQMEAFRTTILNEAE